jgi:hypothetical protein
MDHQDRELPQRQKSDRRGARLAVVGSLLPLSTGARFANSMIWIYHQRRIMFSETQMREGYLSNGVGWIEVFFSIVCFGKGVFVYSFCSFWERLYTHIFWRVGVLEFCYLAWYFGAKMANFGVKDIPTPFAEYSWVPQGTWIITQGEERRLIYVRGVG